MLTLAVTCLGTCTVKEPRFRVLQAFREEQRLLRIKQEILSNSLFVKKAQCINIHYVEKYPFSSIFCLKKNQEKVSRKSK